MTQKILPMFAYVRLCPNNAKTQRVLLKWINAKWGTDVLEI